LKVTPWVFVVWFVLRRQWQLLWRLAVVGIAWLGALAIWFGPGAVHGIFQRWIESSRAGKLTFESVACFESQSLLGFTARLSTLIPGLDQLVFGIPLYRLAWIPVALAFLLVLAVVAFRDGARSGLADDREFAFVCLVMILVSPDSRWAHMIQVLPAFAVLASLAESVNLFGAVRPTSIEGQPTALRGILGPIVLYGLLVMVVLTRDFVGKPLDNEVRWWSAQFMFLFALAILISVALLYRCRPNTAADASPVASGSTPRG